MNMSSACARGHSEVATTSAHKCCPCSDLIVWILLGLLVPPGTLGISCHSVGFVLFSSLYGHTKQLLCEMKAMPVPSLPQMGWSTEIPLHVGLVTQEQLRCPCAPWFTGTRGWESHLYPAYRMSLFQFAKLWLYIWNLEEKVSEVIVSKLYFYSILKLIYDFFRNVLAVPSGKTSWAKDLAT